MRARRDAAYRRCGDFKAFTTEHAFGAKKGRLGEFTPDARVGLQVERPGPSVLTRFMFNGEERFARFGASRADLLE